jgi:hypothetical protein
MRTFYIYAGGAGKTILQWVAQRYYDSSWSENALVECKRLMTIDAQDPSTAWLSNRYGSKNEKLRGLVAAEKISLAVGQGVGMLWPRIVNAASTKFEVFIKSPLHERAIDQSEHFHICHSGGGGTGCGTGPVFSKNLRALNKDRTADQQIYVTASVVLPNKDKTEPLRVPNTCSTIGFHAKSCDGIFVYDLGFNEKESVKNGPILPESFAEQHWLTDYAIAETHLMLTSLNQKTNAILADKDFEGADLGTLCKGVGSTCSLIAPCYAEYSTDLLSELSFEVLVRDLITNRSTIQYSQDKPITRLILFCVFPSSFTNELNKIRKSIKSDLAKDLLPKMNEDAPILFYLNTSLEARKCIKMLALVVNPYMPRLFEMKNEFSKTLEGWRNQEGVRYLADYQKGFDAYDSYLAKIYGNTKN